VGSTGAEGGVDTSARIDEVAAPSPTTAAPSAPLGGAGHAVARGDAEITQHGEVVDPSMAKGPIRIRPVRHR
jgi:hypothetical protein